VLRRRASDYRRDVAVEGRASVLQHVLEQIVGPEPPVAVEVYDGSRVGPADAPATIRVRRPDAIRRIVAAPGELGFSRAYVAGDIDVEGDVFAALSLKDTVGNLSLRPTVLAALAREIGVGNLRPLPPPVEEARLRGRRHTRSRDAAAISHHYDISNEFYRLLLGPSLTYSCAVYRAPDDTLEQAQEQKYELICRKLGLRPGHRLLDVGCGWGGMALHAARHHGAQVVGVTVSRRQAELARPRVDEAGLADRIQVRLQDYRDITDGPFDAISSIGMFEHVGLARLADYMERLHALVRPGGRVLNHGISRPPFDRPRLERAGFMNRYVFPDGELHEIGSVVSAMQSTGFEVRHLENLREHYARTLRAWAANLEARWEEAVALVGSGRARVWRLYVAGSALNFESGATQIHQTLAVRPDRGCSGMPLRPDWGA